MSLPMEKRRYRARARSWALGEASTGTPQIGIEFVIEEGDFRGEWITGYFYFTDAAADRTLEVMRTCGWTGSDLAEALADLDKNVVEIVCQPEDSLPDQQTGEVKQRLRVAFVNKGGGIAMKTILTGDKAKLLAAKMRAKLAVLDAKAKLGGNGNGAPPSAPPTGQPSAAEDDIPF